MLGLVVLLDPKNLIHQATLSTSEDSDVPSLVALTVSEVEGDVSKVLLVVVTHGIKLSADVA